MRDASILDVVRAVTDLAPAHPEVTVWWYSPTDMLRLQGELNAGALRRRPVEVAVEARGTISPEYEEIAAELSERLWGNPVRVRAYEGLGETSRLFRVLSTRRS